MRTLVRPQRVLAAMVWVLHVRGVSSFVGATSPSAARIAFRNVGFKAQACTASTKVQTTSASWSTLASDTR